MIRMLIKGSRADGERAAKQFGVNHIGFEDTGPDARTTYVCECGS